jgi:hypothetical protein
MALGLPRIWVEGLAVCKRYAHLLKRGYGMRRIVLLVALGCAGAALFSGGALAHHSGPEDVATGRGQTAATVTTVTVNGSPIGPTFDTCQEVADFFFPPFSNCNEITVATASTFDFDARLSSQEASTPLGEPHGHMKLSSSTTTTTKFFFIIFGTTLPTGQPPTTTTQSFEATADVMCLTVVNNRAAMSGRVTRYQGTAPPQRGLFFNATDNTIARTQVAPDQFAGTLQPEALQVCPAPSADAPITKGSILIEDN